MEVKVPIVDGYGVETPFFFEIHKAGDSVEVWIDSSFAGRAVEESVSIAALTALAGDEPFEYRDLLGLTLSTDGSTVSGLIGVGSGNERFQLDKAALQVALTRL
jgi:hypothetical protein